MTWNWAALIAAFLATGIALYVRLRWRRSPQAYFAMVAVVACCFVAGAVLGAWVIHATGPGAPSPAPKAAHPAATVASRTPIASPSDSRAAAAPPHPVAGTDYAGPKFTAKVTDVVDGDTVDVAGPNGAARIRLAGIDAPEHGQTFGAQSTRHLAALISGKMWTSIK